MDTVLIGSPEPPRPSVATEEIIRAARDLLSGPGPSITSIAKLLGVFPGTLYNHIPDLRELRASAVFSRASRSGWSRAENSRCAPIRRPGSGWAAEAPSPVHEIAHAAPSDWLHVTR
ncbi:hypothetical protein [Streptomyces sp. NPDC002602]|uniref:hypothetical protein n=1 Tax=Streptomyces sp. NPDC002602 TaxID=3364654 RepID=UPI0036CCA171